MVSAWRNVQFSGNLTLFCYLPGQMGEQISHFLSIYFPYLSTFVDHQLPPASSSLTQLLFVTPAKIKGKTHGWLGSGLSLFWEPYFDLLFTWTSGRTNSPFSIDIFSISVYFCRTPTTTSIIVIDAAVVCNTRPNKGENTRLVGIRVVIISLSIVIISACTTACISTCKYFVSFH